MQKASTSNRPGGLYKTVTFTDLEKKASGHATGRYTKTFTLSRFGPGELEEHIAKLRAEQKEKNNAFLRKKRTEPSKEVTEAPQPAEHVCPHCKAATAPPSPLPKEKPIPESAETPGPATAAPAASRTISLKLDPGTGNSTALLGSSKQGKSTCMMELYRQYYGDANLVATLFASNPQLAMYGDKRLVVCQAYEPKLIKLAAAINRKTKNNYDFCFLLDDIVDKRDDMVLKELILTLRNSNLSSIVCLQYSNLLAKVARANVNNLLLFGFNSDESIELVCKQFLAGHLRSKGVHKDDWAAYYREATKNHGFIYVHPSSGEISYHRLALG